MFATGAGQAKAPGHGGGGGGHGGGGGGHGGGGGGHGGGGHSGGFSGGGGRSFSGGAASFGRSAPTGVSRSSAFAPATASSVRGASASTWNHNGTWNGNWNHNGNWHGDHHGDHHHNNAFFFWGFPFYSSWFGGYPYPYFYGGFPRWYYWNDYAYDPGPAYMYTPDGGSYPVTEQAAQPPADMPKLDDNAVLIAVRVPDNAVIWFDGDKTTQTGTLREFITPPLEPGQRYTYEIKAQWVENGQEVFRTRKMDIYAGDRLMVNFLAPSKNTPPRPAPLKPPTPAPPAPAQSAPVP
jgi:uncharacterized protein (TIGR03000 family)